jgi:hypothetical protein
MLTEHFDIRSVWIALSFANKTFLLFFCGVFVLTFSSSLRALLFMHALKRQVANEQAGSLSIQIDALRKRMANLRQLHLFTLYLLGFCISVQVPSSFHTLGGSATFELSTIMRQLTFLFFFDAWIFLAFLLLHTIQWVVFNRVHSFATVKTK